MAPEKSEREAGQASLPCRVVCPANSSIHSYSLLSGVMGPALFGCATGQNDLVEFYGIRKGIRPFRTDLDAVARSALVAQG